MNSTQPAHRKSQDAERNVQLFNGMALMNFSLKKRGKSKDSRVRRLYKSALFQRNKEATKNRLNSTQTFKLTGVHQSQKSSITQEQCQDLEECLTYSDLS
mmetsp:Transcript_31900/g.36428  ORF Transcript_31900/g.36428 Transcript_31900/m.36428 type:complete len:100 (+) Transcript_31900:426-725(+)